MLAVAVAQIIVRAIAGSDSMHLARGFCCFIRAHFPKALHGSCNQIAWFHGGFCCGAGMRPSARDATLNKTGQDLLLRTDSLSL
jgi:hypothetical protein